MSCCRVFHFMSVRFMKNKTEMMFFFLPQGSKGDPGLSPGQATKGEQVRESLLTALRSAQCSAFHSSFCFLMISWLLFCFILLLLPSYTAAQSTSWFNRCSFISFSSFFPVPSIHDCFCLLEYSRLILFVLLSRVSEEHQVLQALKVF